MFKGKKFLVTGGTGSFGNAVLKRFLDFEIDEIRILSRDEKKQDDMRKRLNSDVVKFYLGDVRDRDTVEQATRGVDYVFHAAALKQVPSCELYPLEAVRTNILGAQNVLDAALLNSVKKVIVLSTDKAVYPINAMGISKAMMEKLMVAKSRMVSSEETLYCATRYGNVMASRGSVIPLFVQQIKAGEPLTLKDPTMTRFMMSLEEAVDLVLCAFNHGEQGDIFVQKAPAATIEILAEVLIDIFNGSSRVEIAGPRNGEKRHETLLTREEWPHSQDLENYFRIFVDDEGRNSKKSFSEGRTDLVEDDYTSKNTHQLSKIELKELLLSLDFIKNELRTG